MTAGGAFSEQATAPGDPGRRDIYVHIGLCKTGTTSLQHWLRTRRSVLAQESILYPRAGEVADHHFGIASLFLDNGILSESTRSTLRVALNRELAAWPGRVILSSEHFSFIAPARLPDVARLLGRPAKIVVSLRQQVGWASAMYAESVRWGGTAGFEAYLRAGGLALDYEPLLRAWEEVFGHENMVVVPYDRSASVRDILRRMSMRAAVAEDAERRPTLNPTLPALLVEVQRRRAQRAPGDVGNEILLQQLATALRERDADLAPETRVPDGAVGLFEPLDASNARLAARYGLPQPLFGQIIADALRANRRQAYAPGDPLPPVAVQTFAEFGLEEDLAAL